MKGKGLGVLEGRLRELSSLPGYERSPSLEEGLWGLDANENLLIPLEELSPILLEAAEELDPRLYPRGWEETLVQALSKNLGTPPESILLGCGCDELIDVVVRVFARRGEEILSVSPTFAMYRWSADLNGVGYLVVPLGRDFSLDSSRLLSHASDRSRICILCSPNNPTGNQFGKEDVRKVIEGFPGIVVVDETYSEFAPYDLMEEVAEYENLVLLRTFSKTYGLAGLRLGYMVADPRIIEALQGRARLPWSINTYAASIALKLLDKPWIVGRAIEKLKGERRRVMEGLNRIEGVKALPSDANFLLLENSKPWKRVWEDLYRRRLVVRGIGDLPPHRDCLRVTVATPEINDRFLEAMKEIYESIS